MFGAASGGRRSDPDRLEAFSDGVMAVIITIMAFDLKEPAGATWHSLEHSLASLLVYILSFTFIGIYWNNHHHLLRSTERISAAVMWSNLHLLFWLSLIPVLTKWMADHYNSHLPASVYGIDGLGAAVAYTILVRAIVACNGSDSPVARAIGDDRKGNASLLLYILGAGLAWITPWVGYALYATVSVMWFVPDRRLEGRVEGAEG
jgi:uncharacterized membrane protein